ncbi:hypothetical protein LCGC14_2413090, partial [marine sediment metagenome]
LIVLLVLVTFFVISFITNLLAPIFPALIQSYNIGLTLAGFFPFAFFIAYGVMSIPAGLLVQSLGEKKVMLIAFSLALFGSVLFVSLPIFAVAMSALFLIGTAMALLQVAINPLLRASGGSKHFAVFSVAAQLMFGGAMIDSSDMLYMEHMQNSAIYNGKFYGYSKMQRMIGHGRSLRKLVDRDFPNVSSIGYAGFSIIAFKRDSKGSKEETDQNKAFVNTMTIGSPNATSLVDPEHDMKVHNVDTDPKIQEMIEMAHYHAEASAKSAEVPTTLISKEKDPNRDTLLGVLRIFLENVITRHRIIIGKKIAAQWYMKNFRIIYKDKPKILEQFHVETEFDDFKLESWADLVSSIVELSKLKPLKAEALGELLGIQNFENMIDPEGDKLEEQSLTDKDGNKLTMTKDNKSKKGNGVEEGPKPNE